MSSHPIGHKALQYGIARDVRDHCLRDGCTTINALGERYGRTPQQIINAIDAYAAWFNRTTVARRGNAEAPAVVVTDAGRDAARTDPFRKYRNLPPELDETDADAGTNTNTDAESTDTGTSTETTDGRRTGVSG